MCRNMKYCMYVEGEVGFQKTGLSSFQPLSSLVPGLGWLDEREGLFFHFSLFRCELNFEVDRKVES